jgi:cation:H+ antiporter
MLGLPSALVDVGAFLLGVVLVVVSVETFVESVAESALELGVSAFFLTVLLAGTDLENAVLGLAAVVDDLPGLALGTVFGEGVFVLGVAVGLAGVFTPFETEVPRSYLFLLLGSPALFFVLAFDGVLTRVDGIVLTAGYLPLVVVVFFLERGTRTQYLGAEEVAEVLDDDGDDDTEDDDDDDGFDLDLDLDLDDRLPWLAELREGREGWFRLGVSLLAVVGMTVGSELAVSGARGLLVVLGLTGLAFGATVMSFIASLEELFLTLEPVRQGRPHLGVGNVLGSTLFFVTANVGVLALVAPIETGGVVRSVHWPFFVAGLVVVGVAFWRGRVGRPTGVALLALYAAYVVVVLAGGTAPASSF